jgi:hypothetical protein
MLIHPWDAATGSAEWQDWLASTGRFGILAVNNLDPARAPLAVPTHFTVAHDELLIHLARPRVGQLLRWETVARPSTGRIAVSFSGQVGALADGWAVACVGFANVDRRWVVARA